MSQSKIYPDSGISIIIAGGGIAGLVTALEGYRNGHKVTVLEAKPTNDPAGDFFMLGPSGTGFLQHWPHLQEQYLNAVHSSVYRWSKYTGKDIYGPIPEAWQSGLVIIRPRLHEILMREVEAIGIELVCNTKVIKYFEEEHQAGVETDDGRQFRADVVVAADGIHSRSWQLVVGTKEEPISSGYAVFRTAMPTSHAFENPLVKDKFGPDNNNGKDVVWFFLGPNTHAICVFGKETTCWAMFHQDKGGNSDESWASHMDAEDAMKLFVDEEHWDPAFIALVRQTPPKSVNDWRLMWRNPQPKTISPGGRVVQVGDAAHSFLPTSANGGTQAMEDAVSLSACLRLATRDKIKLALQVHSKLRFERVACAQKMGLITREHLHKTNWEEIEKDPERISKIVPGQWIARHEPEEYTIRNFGACADHLENGSSFTNTNFPPGYIYEPWDIKQLLQDAEEGKLISEQGDWT